MKKNCLWAALVYRKSVKSPSWSVAASTWCLEKPLGSASTSNDSRYRMNHRLLIPTLSCRKVFQTFVLVEQERQLIIFSRFILYLSVSQYFCFICRLFHCCKDTNFFWLGKKMHMRKGFSAVVFRRRCTSSLLWHWHRRPRCWPRPPPPSGARWWRSCRCWCCGRSTCCSYCWMLQCTSWYFIVLSVSFLCLGLVGLKSGYDFVKSGCDSSKSGCDFAESGCDFRESLREKSSKSLQIPQILFFQHVIAM